MRANRKQRVVMTGPASYRPRNVNRARKRAEMVAAANVILAAAPVAHEVGHG